MAKLKTYSVVQREVWERCFTVRAKDKEEAKQLVYDGNRKAKEKEFIQAETLYDETQVEEIDE